MCCTAWTDRLLVYVLHSMDYASVRRRHLRVIEGVVADGDNNTRGSATLLRLGSYKQLVAFTRNTGASAHRARVHQEFQQRRTDLHLNVRLPYLRRLIGPRNIWGSSVKLKYDSCSRAKDKGKKLNIGARTHTLPGPQLQPTTTSCGVSRSCPSLSAAWDQQGTSGEGNHFSRLMLTLHV